MMKNHVRSSAVFLVLIAFPWTFASGCEPDPELGDESGQTSMGDSSISGTQDSSISETGVGPAESDGGLDSDGSAGTGGIAGTGGTAGTGGAGGPGGIAGTGGTAGTGGAGGTRDGSVDAGPGGGGSPEAGGGDACPRGQVAGNEVLIVGDSYFPAAGSALPNELRRLAGGANYRDVSVPGTKMAAIAASYTRNRTPPPKVVIMDGGGNDILQNWFCEPGCAEHVQAVTDARNFFKTMAMDGSVKQIVFIFYYDMPLMKDGLDWMRPRMAAECQMSPVPCFFVDNQPLFTGQDASAYTTDGIHPTAAAAKIIAKQAWDIMVTNCIAQ
jgi:hypothetical protein